jgi:hypothetical protein
VVYLRLSLQRATMPLAPQGEPMKRRSKGREDAGAFLISKRISLHVVSRRHALNKASCKAQKNTLAITVVAIGEFRAMQLQTRKWQDQSGQDRREDRHGRIAIPRPGSPASGLLYRVGLDVRFALENGGRRMRHRRAGGAAKAIAARCLGVAIHSWECARASKAFTTQHPQGTVRSLKRPLG